MPVATELLQEGLVIPPIRLGTIQFDLAFLILLIALQILINVALLL